MSRNRQMHEHCLLQATIYLVSLQLVVCLSPIQQGALNYAVSAMGTHYGWWLGGEIPKIGPAWADDRAAPSLTDVRRTSVFCAGIPNLMLRHVGGYIPCDKLAIPDPECGQCCGGTGAYGVNYSYSKYQKFDLNASYPPGTLLGRPYYGVHDQGHVAVLLGEGKTAKLLQSYVQPGPGCPPGVEPCNKTTPGVDSSYTLEEAVVKLPWFCNFTYALLPDDWLITKCYHGEDEHRHRCWEACSDSAFTMKGITKAGYCPTKYDFEEKTEQIQQCFDGVTNIKGCPDKTVTVTLKKYSVMAECSVSVRPWPAWCYSGDEIGAVSASP